MLDPQDGFIVTANNAVIGPDYPIFLTDDWSFGDRAARTRPLIEAAGPLDVDGMLAIDFDQHGPLADLLAPALAALRPRAAQPGADAVTLLRWLGRPADRRLGAGRVP